MKSALSDFVSGEKGIYGVLHIAILVMSLFLVTSISVDTFKGIPFYTQFLYMKVQLCICLRFFFDFVLEFFLTKHKERYLQTRFIFLLVTIPYQNIITYYGWTFSDEIIYLLRFTPLLRGGHALIIVVGWLTHDRTSSLSVSYLAMLLATVYFSNLASFVPEHRVSPLVNSYGDVLWWAFMDVTTVSSNIIAQTAIGRILSILLAALSMTVLLVFTAYITNLIQQSNERKRQYYEEEELEKKTSGKRELTEKVAIQKGSVS